MDESGTHDGSHSVTVAGFISLADMWVDFSAKWQLALNDFGIDHFHMADFAQRVAPFDSWTEEERRLRLARLLCIISDNTLGSAATTIPLKAFEEIFSPRAKALCGGAYGLAAMVCFMDLSETLRDTTLDGWVNYVFESGARGSGQIATLFKLNERDRVQKDDLRLQSLRFENKRQFLPLQAADILAYELYKSWRRGERPMRYPLLELAKEPRRWGYLNEEELRKWNRILSMRVALEDEGMLKPLR